MAPDIDSLVYRPGQTTPPPPSAPGGGVVAAPGPQQNANGRRSFDDPAFIDELMSAGSPEGAEALWRKHTNADNVLRGLEDEMASIARANPDIPMNRLTYIAEARRAELMSQAPGLQALQIAKQRLTQDKDVATGVFQAMDYDRKAEVQRVMTEEGLPFPQAVLRVSQSMPEGPEATESKAGSRSSVPTSNLDLLNPETKGRVASIVDAETTNQIKNSLAENLETSMTFARSAVEILNTPMETVDENDPDALAKQEELQQQKAKARADIDILLELQREGRSPVAIARGDSTGTSIVAATKAGKPVLVEMPGGKEYRLQKFDSVEEAQAFMEEDYRASKESTKQETESKKPKATGMIDRMGQFFGTQSVARTDEIIKENEEIIKQLESDPVKSTDIVARLEALERIGELKKYREKRAEKEKTGDALSRYSELKEKEARLEELSKSENLSPEAQRELTAESAQIWRELRKLKESEELQKIWGDARKAPDAVPWF